MINASYFISDKEALKKLVQSRLYEIYGIPPKHTIEDRIFETSRYVGRNEFVYFVRTLYLAFEFFINTNKNTETLRLLIYELEYPESSKELFYEVGKCLRGDIRADGGRSEMFLENSRTIINFLLVGRWRTKGGGKDDDDSIPGGIV